MVERLKLIEGGKPANVTKLPVVPRKRLVVTDSQIARVAQSGLPRFNPFKLPAFPKAAIPPKGSGMALDDSSDLSENFNWAANAFSQGVIAMYAEGLVFPGYPYLAELSQRPEYRKFAETLGTESTRKWIKLASSSTEDDTSKAERIKAIEDELDRLKVRDCFGKVSQIDSFFGRGHLYIDVGNPELGPDDVADDTEELLTPIGNGRSSESRAKIGKGFLRRLKAVEPVWCYPTSYNANNPLSTSWYEPDVWYVMGKRIHKSRLLKFVAREVPDMLKPAYAFGGLSMSQMAKPYVDNWLNTRQSVADIIKSFSTWVLSTDLGTALTEGGDLLFKRLELFNVLRDNKGVMALDKETEEFTNVAAPLGTLDSLQAQTQEHMASVSSIPIVKLLGIQPAGLNASSEGEIRTFYDVVLAYQEKLYRDPLTRIIDMVQLSLFGDVDQSITFKFVPLWELDEAASAGKRKTEADTDVELINAGVISPLEARRRIAADPETPYQSLDVEDVPEPPQQGGEGGMPGMGGEGEPDGEGSEEGSPAEGAGERGLGGARGPDGGGGNGGGTGGGSKRGIRGSGDSEAGRLSPGGPKDGEDGEEDRIRRPERNRLTAGAALVRQERRAGGGFAGDVNTVIAQSALRQLVLALDEASWEEGKHPRDENGKFVGYGIASGLKNKASKLGFTKVAASPSGKLKFEHPSGGVLIVEPSSESGGSKKYSFYMPGQKPIKGTTGQSGKSFAEKVGAAIGNAPAVESHASHAKQKGLDPAQPQVSAEEAGKVAQQAPKPTNEPFNKQAHTALMAKGWKPQPAGPDDPLNLSTYHKSDYVIKIDKNGDWLSIANAYSAKAGSGIATLNSFLAGEKGLNKYWNSVTQDSWLKDHDPNYVNNLSKSQQTSLARKQEHSKAQAKKYDLLDQLKGDYPEGKMKSAVSSYTGSGYGSINDNLRSGGEITKGSNTAYLKKYLDSCSIPEDVVLYRGVNGSFAHVLKQIMVEGTVFEDKGFTSTSADPHMGFVNGASLKMKIYVPKGARGASVSHISSHPGESEVLFTAGTRYRVKSFPKKVKTNQGGEQWIEVEMLLHDEKVA